MKMKKIYMISWLASDQTRWFQQRFYDTKEGALDEIKRMGDMCKKHTDIYQIHGIASETEQVEYSFTEASSSVAIIKQE